MFTISRYTHSCKEAWDCFVRAAKNATFLFYRDYMDYHADRFVDYSLMFHRNGRLAAIMPATLNGLEKTITSHAGLTFGGIVTCQEMSASLMLNLFDDLCAFLRGEGIARLIYKALPHIYHEVPAEEDRYALFRAGARLYRREVSATVALDRKLPFQDRRRRGVKKARTAGVIVRSSNDLASFWPILEQTLQTRHGVRPVHSLAEIQLLHQRFPSNIKLFAAYLGNSMLAGVLIYEHRRVAHAQYISASEVGKSVGALDLLFEYLITEQYQGHAYFDFGVSTEDQGKVLNVGLSKQKEGFGARTVVHDFYDLDLTAAA